MNLSSLPRSVSSPGSIDSPTQISQPHSKFNSDSTPWKFLWLYRNRFWPIFQGENSSMINPTGESNIYNMDNGSNTSPTQKNGTESNLKRTHSNVSSSTNQNPESPSRCSSRNRPASNKSERNNLSRTSSQVSVQHFWIFSFLSLFLKIILTSKFRICTHRYHYSQHQINWTKRQRINHFIIHHILQDLVNT